MSWIPLNSTAIHAARYDKAEGILELEFRDGTIYRSCAIPEPIFQEFLQAESKGRYFNFQLRKKFVFDSLRAAATTP